MKAWNPYLYKERYCTGFSQKGVRDSFTKKPESSIKGINMEGIKVTAFYLLEKATEIIMV
jgi:hypothetical protein